MPYQVLEIKQISVSSFWAADLSKLSNQEFLANVSLACGVNDVLQLEIGGFKEEAEAFYGALTFHYFDDTLFFKIISSTDDPFSLVFATKFLANNKFINIYSFCPEQKPHFYRAAFF